MHILTLFQVKIFIIYHQLKHWFQYSVNIFWYWCKNLCVTDGINKEYMTQIRNWDRDPASRLDKKDRPSSNLQFISKSRKKMIHLHIKIDKLENINSFYTQSEFIIKCF